MTRDELIKLARECQMPYLYQTGDVVELERLGRFADLVAAATREECAKVCEHQPHWRACAAAIRARGQG